MQDNRSSMISHFREMLRSARLAGNLNQEVMALQNLGGLHEAAGDYQTAIGFMQECVSVCLNNNGSYCAAECLEDLSDLHAYKLGDRESALGYLTQAVDIAPAGPLKQRLGDTLDRVRSTMGLPSRPQAD